MYTDHPQVPVEYYGQMIEVDEGMAELLQLLWGHGIDTSFSCQGNESSRAYMVINDMVSFYDFANLINTNDTLWKAAKEAKFVHNYDPETWVFSLDGNPLVEDFCPRVAVYFPTKHIELLVNTLKSFKEEVQCEASV